MATPSIVITTRTPNSTVQDLTALTGGLKGGQTRLGFDGTDFLLQDSYSRYPKAVGDNQLQYGIFADDGGAMPYQIGYGEDNLGRCLQADVNTGYDDQQFKPGYYEQWAANAWACPRPNMGLTWAPYADQRRREMYVTMSCYGAFQVEAVLEDGSATVAPFTLPNNGAAWWKCVWIGKDEGRIRFKVRSLATNVDAGIVLKHMWIPAIGVRPRPRNFGV